jgi:hypothetical protein
MKGSKEEQFLLIVLLIDLSIYYIFLFSLVEIFLLH